jgi:plastocyanin
VAVESRAARRARTHTVIIQAVVFSPPALVVRQGDMVVWVNRDPFPHTATAADGSFDSKSIAAGQSWKYVARKLGEHPYGCTFHPTMKGMLTVE